MENFFSLVFYLLLLSVLLRLCGAKVVERKHEKYIRIAYLILFIVSAVRFGIGNDYLGYAHDCIYISKWFDSNTLNSGFRFFGEDIEVAHIFFCWLLQWTDYPFVGLYFIYSLIQVCLLYLILKRSGEHYWGLFLFIVGEFMFCSWDAIRQFTAVLIIAYSYDYVKNRKIILFFICIGLAWLFHHSAIYVLPIFLLTWIRIPRWILMSVIATVTIVSVSGIIQQYQDQVAMYFDLIDEYSGYASNMSTTVVAESMQYRLRLLLVGALYIVILFYYPKGNPLNEILLTIGVSIFIFATNSLTLMRISWYFWVACIVMIGPSIKEINRRKLKGISYGIVIAFLFIFSHDVLTGSNARGCETYKTIFTSNLQQLPPRP